jgi:hypothetical protein
MEIDMSFVGDFIGDVFGGITGAKQAGEAAERAGQVQAGAAEAGIAEQRRQFDKLIEIMAPFVAVGAPAIEAMRPFEEAGLRAFQQQQALTGLLGPEAQQEAVNQLAQSPQFQALTRQGEESLLQRASATGGLRGGNVQAALAQFRPQMLQQEIETQLGRLGGIAGTGLGVSGTLLKTGQASAAGQAAAGMESAGAIGDLLAQAGAARAGGIIGKGGVARQTFGDILSIGKAGSGFF